MCGPIQFSGEIYQKGTLLFHKKIKWKKDGSQMESVKMRGSAFKVERNKEQGLIQEVWPNGGILGWNIK